MKERKCFYSSRKWLNPEDSAATGSVVCYDGTLNGEIVRFMELASCNFKARLHQYKDCSEAEYIQKLTDLRDELNKYIEHLNSNKEDEDETRWLRILDAMGRNNLQFAGRAFEIKSNFLELKPKKYIIIMYEYSSRKVLNITYSDNIEGTKTTNDIYYIYI